MPDQKLVARGDWIVDDVNRGPHESYECVCTTCQTVFYAHIKAGEKPPEKCEEHRGKKR